MADQCRPLLGDDGQVIASIRGAEPLSPEAQAAMRDLVAAVIRMEQADPDRDEKAARQAAALERIRERNARLRGNRG